MKNRIFTGAGTALITPMNADGSVNYNRLCTLVDEQIEGGIDSLIICGTTGEGATLSHEEHVKVIETAVKQAKKRVPVIAGTGSNDTAYAVELSEKAVSIGADALLMVTPYYNKTSQRGLIAHYTYICERISAPIILYNVPSRTGMKITVDTYKELSKLDNIVATKEASGDLGLIKNIIDVCGDSLDVYSGNDDQTYDILALGGIGIISVFSNILPDKAHELCRSYFDGDIEKSRQMQEYYLPLMNALFSDVNPIPVKDAMNLIGMNAGPCRLPLISMSDDGIAALKNELVKYGLIK